MFCKNVTSSSYFLADYKLFLGKSSLVDLKVWSPDLQHKHHLGVLKKTQFPGPTSELLNLEIRRWNQQLRLNKPGECSVGLLKYEKWVCQRQPFAKPHLEIKLSI